MSFGCRTPQQLTRYILLLPALQKARPAVSELLLSLQRRSDEASHPAAMISIEHIRKQLPDMQHFGPGLVAVFGELLCVPFKDSSNDFSIAHQLSLFLSWWH